MANLISVGQVFDKTVDHYKKHFSELIAISAWMMAAAVPAAVGKLVAPFSAGSGLTALDWIAVILKNGGGLLLAVVSILVLIVIVKRVADQAAGAPRNQPRYVNAAKRLFFPYVWTSILFILLMIAAFLPPIIGIVLIIISSATGSGAILSLIGVLLLTFGGIFSALLAIKLSIEYGFAPYILILEEESAIKKMTLKEAIASGVRSMKASSALVKGRWWATFFRFIIPKFIYAFIVSLANLLAAGALLILVAITLGPGALGSGVGSAALFLISMLVTMFVTPLVSITDFYIYDSLRKNR
jgi:hypothetical protein